MVKTCPDGFGEILESCIFHRTIITWRDHKQFCLKSAKRLGNTSGYSSATGYSFRICKGQSRSCKSMKGVKTSSHSSLNAREMPSLFFFFLLKISPKNHYQRWGNTFSKSAFNLLTEELLLLGQVHAHWVLIACLSTWTFVFKMLFFKCTKLQN